MKKDYIKDIEGAERRFINPNIETRKEGDEEVIEGVAAVVGVTTDLGWFEERIEKGAFDDVLSDDVRALFNHDPNFVLARSIKGKGTLKIFTDKEGNLRYSFPVANRSYARDLHDAIKSGDISQSSFAFRIKEEKWEWADNENGRKKDLRTIVKFEKLYDVAPVTYPAYADTSVAARMKMGDKKEYTDEQFLADMIKHHEGAIEMSERILKNSENDEVVSLAEGIISAQKAEIKAMKKMKKSLDKRDESVFTGSIEIKRKRFNLLTKKS